MLLRPLNVREPAQRCPRVARDSRHNTLPVPGRWDSHPHLGVVLLTSRLSAHGMIVRRRRALKAARRQLELRYPAARGDCPYAPILRNTKAKRPTRVACAGGASNLLDSKGVT
jgi:hypothetical protein